MKKRVLAVLFGIALMAIFSVVVVKLGEIRDSNVRKNAKAVNVENWARLKAYAKSDGLTLRRVRPPDEEE